MLPQINQNDFLLHKYKISNLDLQNYLGQRISKNDIILFFKYH
jgi:hypothetical protein